MTRKKITLEDLNEVLGGASGVPEKMEDRKRDDSEGAQSGKHGVEYTGTEKDVYIVGPGGGGTVKKLKERFK